MIKYKIALISIALISINSFGQISRNNWLTLENENIEHNSFWELKKKDLGLNNSYSFKEIKQERDELGILHSRFNQYYNNLKIEGAQFLIHSKNGLVTSANGKLVNGITSINARIITFQEALTKAKSHITTDYFYWENAEMEKLIKYIHNNDNETFYPKKELVYFDPEYSQEGGNYALAYKLDLYFEGEHDHRILFIDAVTGDLLMELEGCHNAAAKGTSKTKYHGTVNIITDINSSGKYILRDNTRGGGIETYDMNKGTNTGNAVDFEDADNYWNNTNFDLDEVAGDVHWSTEMTYDYYISEHNRNSYNNSGGKIVSLVHYSNNWRNASWNGQFARYGDGNNAPLTSIDIIAHELSHGVTGNSAALVYKNESGALNESFSDIFGTAVEHKYFPISKNWKMGTGSFLLRDLSAPKVYNDPNTYYGINWQTGTSDNGGVHTNSGVQNFWFYLLSVGKTGVNDNGTSYTVNGIGIDKAAKIAYRNLTVYLTNSSTYIDARNGSIQAAKDLYGNCSIEANAVASAWHAVGIGTPYLTDDIKLAEIISPRGDCNLSKSETIKFSYQYDGTGCNSALLAGDSIVFGYKFNGKITKEVYFLKADIKSGDVLNFTFQNTEDLSLEGNYTFDFFIHYNNDLNLANDSTLKFVIKNQKLVTNGDNLTFEDANVSKEEVLYSTFAGNNAQVKNISLAANQSSLGKMYTGNNFNANSHTYNTKEADNFVTNPEYIGEICMCVDATEYDKLSVVFDLRQTYSQTHATLRNIYQAKVLSSLRLTVNGTQIGNQYHPKTYDDDSWKTQVVSLSNYVQQEFNLCFEGKHFINIYDESISTYGDNSFIDNIHFNFSTNATSVYDNTKENPNFSVFPNPNSGEFQINVSSNSDSELSIEIRNSLGQIVHSLQKEIQSGDSSILMDLTDQNPGIYFLSTVVDGDAKTLKIIVQ